MINILPLPSYTSHWTVNVDSISREYKSILAFITRLTLNSVSRFKNETVVVNLHFASMRYSKFLNKKYRGKNNETNVLSFPADALPVEIEGVERELGDIYLCKEVIEREATESNKLFINHMLHIVVHGILHLLGYDHENDQDAERMEQKEISILHKIGISSPYSVQTAESFHCNNRHHA